MHNFDMNNWNMHGFGWIFWIILIGLAVWLIVYLASGRNKGYVNETTIEILKKRYARGEISREEFEEKKKELE